MMMLMMYCWRGIEDCGGSDSVGGCVRMRESDSDGFCVGFPRLIN